MPGIIDVGDGWACAFKIESHNHPSYIEPYQGAATGVGGILRDIFTMNARPLAVMDSLRFGPLDEAEPDEALRRKNHQIVNGVVAWRCRVWELFWGSEPWVGRRGLRLATRAIRW